MNSKLKYKELVLEKAIDRQKQIINDFRGSIQEMKNSEMAVNEDQYDLGQGGFNSGSSEMIENLDRELNFVLKEMDLLQILKENLGIKDRVALGSIVETDKATFFPSVSIENFDVNGKSFLGISRDSPIFQEMTGKKKGESFRFGDQEYFIVDLY
ncbi:hypothetical protein [Salinimicrobium sp. TH3]|uniref:hypothetical protein n=1 Tax=Salinimicrobium sp. TH3 TaxID=2997342 RepID=UPI00227409BB|nr:hypothetical protein [Salinimicrobium sp. TH3]MCY2685874.1 hypothetical protein [Salinimicrobium sp. TH3]